MSTDAPTTVEGIDSDDVSFVATGEARPLGRSDLDAMAAPEDGTPKCYAVGRVEGTLHSGPGISGVSEGYAILYVSQDGEHAVERWIPARRPLDTIPRAIAPSRADVEPAGPNARAYQPVLERHPKPEEDA